MTIGGTLTHAEARAFYDRFGAKQDWQRFYEDAAVEELIAHMAFDRAAAVLEFGCGTGRLAERLLQRALPPHARYTGVDVSATMVALTRRRLAPYGHRVRVVQSTGEPRLADASASCDRLVTTYVLDLLLVTDIRTVLAEAWRVLTPGGRLGIVSLGHGATGPARLVERVWTRLYRTRPSWVGGCRPISLGEFVDARWHVRHRAAITRWFITSEVAVAEKPEHGASQQARGSRAARGG